MKHAIVGSLTALLAGAGLALAQPPEESPLPAPRAVGTASNEVAPDQAGVLPIVNPENPGQTPYGPPPSMYAPVCPTNTPPFRFWTEFDYHLWWVKQNKFPPLLVGGADVGAPLTTVLVGGGDTLDRAVRNGGGMTFGGWVTDYQGFGIEAGFFVMESANKNFSVAANGSPGTPVIARPFFDVIAGQPGFLPIAAPGLFSGSAAGSLAGVQCDSGRFAGADVHAIGNIACTPEWRWDFLVGYRYLTLNDRFAMTTSSAAIDGVPLPNGQALTSVSDRIDTSNTFSGADFGLRCDWHCSDRLQLRGTARVAFGGTDERSTVAGMTSTLDLFGVPGIVPTGFLARPSNSGPFKTSQFAVVPELNLALGYQVFDFMRVTVGYSFLYWSNVARSGGQVDLNVNRLEVPSITPPGLGFTPPQPLAQIHCTDFWAQGINVGLEFRY